MPTYEDLDPYFDDFGETVLVGQPGVEMVGIFDNEYSPVTESDYAEVSSTLPTLFAKTADCTALGISVELRTQIVIGGTYYTVRDMEPDGLGVTSIFLWRKDS